MNYKKKKEKIDILKNKKHKKKYENIKKRNHAFINLHLQINHNTMNKIKQEKYVKFSKAKRIYVLCNTNI